MLNRKIVSFAIALSMIFSGLPLLTQDFLEESQGVEQSSSSLSGTGGLADSPWPMFRQNLNHTGLSPYDTSANPGKLKWSFLTGASVDSSPTIGLDGTIYVGSDDNKLYAINPDGTQKWNFTTQNHVNTAPAIGSDGTIYIGSWDKNLYAINPDGTEKWSFTTGAHVDSSPVIDLDGTIYVGSGDHKLYAINPDGTEKWSYTTGWEIWSSPAIGLDGTIYVGSEDHKLYAFNPDGTKEWSFTTELSVVSTPGIGYDGTIYVGSYDDKLYAINPNGTEKWSFKTGGNVLSSPAIGSDGTIYIGSHDDKLYAINTDGTEKWNFTTYGNVFPSPAIGFDGTIYIGSYDNRIYAINSNGTEKWHFTTGQSMQSSPAIGTDGTIYIGSGDHKLYAIGTPTPDILVEKTANVTTAKPGDLIEYTIYYNNTGPGDAATVWINDTLPEGVTFVTSSAEGNRTGEYNWTFYDVQAKIPTWFGPYLPAIRPSSFEEHDMAYDSTNNRVVLFGGFRNGTRLDETWEYDTATHAWYGPYMPNPRPNPRVDHAMAYDSINNKVVLYGGWDGTGYGKDDTWEYDTATHTWSGPYLPSIRPPELYEHDMTYDSANNKVVLFGGYSCTGSRFDETWEYDTATHTWSGPYMPNPRPSSRHEHAMAYDSSDNKVVLYGGWDGSGATSDETWEYDTATHIWSGPYIPASHPSSYNEHDMAYDSANDRVVLFGGFCSGVRLDETWEYDTSTHTWYGPIMPDPRPSPRNEHAMTYDSINNKVVLYGGWDGSGSTSDETWEYTKVSITNYFTITVQINLDVPNGTILTNYVHLDYTDSLGNIMLDSIDSADVLVLAPENKPPIANAGPDQTVNEGEPVFFKGCGSYDPEGMYIHYDFDTSDEGFVKETDYSNSDVHWDSANGNVYFKAHNSDPGDEIFTKPLSFTIDENSGSWNLSARTMITDPGVWQDPFLLFIADSSTTEIVNRPNTLSFEYFSAPNPPPGHYPLRGRYIDSSGVRRILLFCPSTVNTEYILKASYDYGCKKITMQIFDENENVLSEGSYTIGTNPSDGFTFGKIGVGTDGYSGSPNPVYKGWTDDITFRYYSLTYEWDFDADVDSDGDGNYTNDVDATGPMPTHVYGDDGVYTVTLTVKKSVEGEGSVKVDQDTLFCVDTSGSMLPGSVDLAKEGLLVYVNEMSIPDHGAVVVFNTGAWLSNPLTDDYIQLKNDIAAIPGPDGATYMGEALQTAIDELLANGSSDHIQVIILLTDGVWNGALNPLDQADRAAANNFTIYIIGLEPSFGFDPPDESLLRYIANITGGKYYYAPDASYLSTIYREIAQLVEYPYGEVLSDMDTMQVTVKNVAPTVTLAIVPSGDEGSELIFEADATDPGSDDLKFSWEFEYGPTIENIHYNDGVSLEPIYDPVTNEIKSPWGAYPFNVSDTVNHTYGDDYNYTLVLTVSDDDGGTVTYTSTISIDNVAPSIVRVWIPYVAYEGSSAIYGAVARDNGSDDLTFEWDFGDSTPIVKNIHYNNGTSPDPYPSPDGTYPFTASDTLNHTYGDDYNYTLTLKVTDDDGGITAFSTTVYVNNVAPTITPFFPTTIFEEGMPITLSANATDLGSDDLTFTWEFEHGPTITNTYYNDGIGPDPYPSPWGIYPFSAIDTVGHTYGDNGNYSITLTVEDDDGAATTYMMNITVNNVAPVIEPFGPFTVDEGSPINLTAISKDQGSDDLKFEWNLEFGPTITNTFYNDGVGPDPYPSPWGTYAFNATDTVTHTYGDNYVYNVSLTVTDDDGDSTTYTTNVTVNNVPPTVVNIKAYMHVNFTLRVAGEKWHSVNMTLFEDDIEIWSAGVTRQPGSPDDQAATLSNYKINIGSCYRAVVDYLPNDPRVNGNVWGANPVWVILTFEDGSETRIHHTFNVRKSYWDSDHWNHIDPWDVDLTGVIYRHNITFEAEASDVGSDDLTFTWDFGDGGTAGPNTYFNNGVSPDLYPSPEINPMSATDMVMYAYSSSGNYTVTLTITDDDGGIVVATLVINLQG